MISKVANKNPDARRLRLVFIAVVILFISVIFSLTQGSMKISIADIIDTLMGKASSVNEFVIFNIRLPRIIMTAFIGIGLALSGCIIQCIARNPLAETGLLGINAGAGLTVILYVIIFGTSTYTSIFIMPLLSIVGASIAVLIVYLIAFKKGEGLSTKRLILTGVAVQAGLSALTLLMVVKLNEEQYHFFVSWQSGQIVGASWTFLMAFIPWIIVLVPYVLKKAKVLDILNFGEYTAYGLGVNVEKERRVLFMVAVALGAVCVAFGGNIAFIGLVAPHLARRLIGPKHKFLLPLCLIIGGILVVIADTIGRVIVEPSFIPTGIMTAIIGAPYFIYILIKLK